MKLPSASSWYLVSVRVSRFDRSMFKLEEVPPLGKERCINQPETKERSYDVSNSEQIVENEECILRLHHPSCNEFEKPNFEIVGDDVKNEYPKLDLNYTEALPDKNPELSILPQSTDESHHNYEFADGKEHGENKCESLLYLPNIEKSDCIGKTEDNNETVSNESLGIMADNKNVHDHSENAAIVPELKLEFTKEAEDLLDEYIDYFTQISDYPENDSDQSKTDKCKNTLTSNEAKNEQILCSDDDDDHTISLSHNKEMTTDDICAMRYRLGMQIAISENVINEHLELYRDSDSVRMGNHFYLQTHLERLQKDRQLMMQLDRKVDSASIERNYEISQKKSAKEFDENDDASCAEGKHSSTSSPEVSMVARSVDLSDTSDKNVQRTPLNVDDIPQDVTAVSPKQQFVKNIHEEQCAEVVQTACSPQMDGRSSNGVDANSIVKPCAKESVLLKAIEDFEDCRESEKDNKGNLTGDALKGVNDADNFAGVKDDMEGVKDDMEGAKSGNKDFSYTNELVDSTTVLCQKDAGDDCHINDKLKDCHDDDDVCLLDDDGEEAHVIVSHIVNNFINCIIWREDAFNVIDIECSDVNGHQDLMSAGSNSYLLKNEESDDASKVRLILSCSNGTAANLNQVINSSESLVMACEQDANLSKTPTEHVIAKKTEMNRRIDVQESLSSQAKSITKSRMHSRASPSCIEDENFRSADLDLDGKEIPKSEFSIISESFSQSSEVLEETKEVPEMLETADRTWEDEENESGNDVTLVSSVITCIDDQTSADELRPSKSECSYAPVKEVSDASHSQPECAKSFQVQQLKILEYNDLSDYEAPNGSKTPTDVHERTDGSRTKATLLDPNHAGDMASSFDGNARQGFNSDASFMVNEWIDLPKPSAYYLNNTLCEETLGNWLSKSFVKETLSEDQQNIECQDGVGDSPSTRDDTINDDVEREEVGFCTKDDSDPADRTTQSDGAGGCTQESNKDSTEERINSLAMSDSEAGIAMHDDSDEDKIGTTSQDRSKPSLFGPTDFEQHGFLAKNPSPIVGGAFQNKRSRIGDDKADEGMKKRKKEKYAVEFSVVPQLDNSKDNEDFQTMFEGKNDPLLSTSLLVYHFFFSVGITLDSH